MGVRYVAVDDAEGQRLDNFLMRELKGVPKSRVYRLLRRGEVRVNGGRSTPDYRLKKGDRVRLPPFDAKPATPSTPSPKLIDWLERSILFEDEAVIVIDKPSGIAVHGGSGISSGVIEALRARGGSARLELAHRLDRDTSGCLVLAKTRAALAEWHGAFREGRVQKRYDVLVHGRWPRRLRFVDWKLARYALKSGERRVRVDVGGQAARTDFDVRESSARGSWLRCHPHTGRTHQIRVHCSASEHAVVGDTKYASDEELALAKALGIKRLCLHASSLALVGSDGKRRRFDAPIPDDFDAAWRALSGAR
jgi:23S rRNA pseudouridine955/2504/2580 synthase